MCQFYKYYYINLLDIVKIQEYSNYGLILSQVLQMKCFMHIYDEAIAVCNVCGKAMCGNCSAYTNHSGICPECRRKEFINERSALNDKLNSIKKSTVLHIALAVILTIIAAIGAITVSVAALLFLIGTLICVIKILKLKKQRTPVVNRISWLTAEINKLTVALHRSRAVI